MVVDGEHDRPDLAGGGRQPDRRSPTVRADLDERLARNRHRSLQGGGVQCVTLHRRHEPLRRDGVVSPAPCHGATLRRHATTAVRPAVGGKMGVDVGAGHPRGTPRPRADRGQHVQGDLAGREAPAGFRRPGRGSGAGGRGANRGRSRPARPLAARLLPAARGPDRADPVRGRPAQGRAQLHHPAGGRDPARKGDLQPAGQLPQARSGARSSDRDARGRAGSRVAADLARAVGAVQGRPRRALRTAATDRPAPRVGRPDEPQGQPGRRPAGLAAGRRAAAGRSGAPRVHRHVRQRHDAPRHGGAALRAGLGLTRREHRPVSTTRCGSTERSVPTSGYCTTSTRSRPRRREVSPAARSSPPTGGSSSVLCRKV